MKKYIVPAVKAMNLETESVLTGSESLPTNPGKTTTGGNGGWTREDNWNDSDWSEDEE